MKLEISNTGGQIAPGTTLSMAFPEIEKKFFKKDIMVQAIEKETGKTGLVVILNNRVIPQSQFSSICLKEGDDLRIQHPFFGG